MVDMTDKELITITIDRYTDLQRIKKAVNTEPICVDSRRC